MTVAALAIACAVGTPLYASENEHVGPIADIVPGALLADALTARSRFIDHVDDLRWLTIIDYSRPSSERRMFVVDLETDRAEALLVAHGAGSDPDNDGYADRFSDILHSRMTSLGAFVTGESYIGKFGRAVRLHGLEASNANAYARAIVMHGADYVSPDREIMGRSWGCPAIELPYVERIVGQIAYGTFLYAVGGDGDEGADLATARRNAGAEHPAG